MDAAAGLILLAAALLVASALIVRANRRERAARKYILRDCAGLLDEGTAAIAPSGFGVHRGVYRGRRAALTPIAEALAFRKLPQLWIAAALADPDPDRPSIEIVRRPAGSEFFTGGADARASLRPPASWPQDTSVRASRGAAPLLRSLEQTLAAPLADPKLKSVSIGPSGVRVVRHAAQGARGAYLLFREMRFEANAVPVKEACAALDLSTTIAQLIAAPGTSHHAVQDHDAAEPRAA